MKKEKLIVSGEILFVVILAIIVGILVMLHVIVGSAKTPTGFVYLGTGHYYLDYFYYLTPIAQGIRGHWLSFQQVAIGDIVKYPHLTPYIFIGQIASLAHLSPVEAYWLSVFVFSLLLVIIFYITISKVLKAERLLTKISALLLSLFAGSFYDFQVIGKTIQISNQEFWYSVGNFFRRFEPVPHHILSSIFILLIMLVCGDFIDKIKVDSFKNVIKKTFIASFLFVGLLSFNSYSIVVPFAAMGIVLFVYLLKALIYRDKTFFNIVFFGGCVVLLVLISAYLLKAYYTGTSFMEGFKNVEIYLHQGPGIRLVLLNTGPIVFLAFFGMIKYFRKMNGLRLMMIVFLFLSYVFYFSSLDKILGTHNGRFLSSTNYIVFGILGGLGISQISEFFNKGKRAMMIILLLIFILYSIPPAIKSFKDLIGDRNIFSPITYLQADIVSGFKMLDKFPEKGNVLVTPSQFLGTVLPVYTDRKNYVARQIVTPDYINKNITTSNFYMGSMTNELARDFLRRNNISFVVLTSIEGYDVQFLYKYPFLQEIHKSSSIVIFKVK